MKQSAYALKLAGAAALAGSSQAYGQIIPITPPTNITNPSGAVMFMSEYYNVLTGVTNTSGTPSPTDDFNFSYYLSTNGNSSTYVDGLKATSLIASTYAVGYLYADALAKGTKIGTDTPLQFNQISHIPSYPAIYLTDVEGDGTVTTPSNLQQPNVDEYLGFQFLDSNDGLIHNGWLELDSPTYPGSNLSGITFIAGAYNSIPDSAPGGLGDIAAGEEPAAVPEPGSLSLLVLGAAALGGIGLAHRRRAALAVAQD
jgi:hypothetical protein